MREASSVAMPVHRDGETGAAPACARDNGGIGRLDDGTLPARCDHMVAVRALADAIEAKDPSVRTHSEEVARYSGVLATRMGLGPDRREELLLGSLLHDVGKICISARILLKPARLTAEEFDLVKLHPAIGHRLVRGIPALSGIAAAVLHHHERYDGTGYPTGLAGADIPLEARIIGVADSFSAMLADRPYSRGRSPAEACAELERCAGTQFDPEVVELFVEEVRRHPPSHEEPVLLAGARSEHAEPQPRHGDER